MILGRLAGDKGIFGGLDNDEVLCGNEDKDVGPEDVEVGTKLE